MSLITNEELITHLYKESIDIISGYDETVVEAAIDAAQQEMKCYLTYYDTDKIFNAQGSERNALLVTFLKDIAVWHFVNICNAGTDLELRGKRYDRAIAFLKDVQKGNIKPDLPIIDNDNDGKSDKPAEILVRSNPKRNQHY